MKICFFFMIMLLAVNGSNAQVKLDARDLSNLVAISELYSKGGSPSEYAKSLDALRTPRLSSLVNTLIATGSKDGAILDTKFFRRPSDEELMMWYVIREIHYNRNSEKRKPRPNLEVAQKVLSKNIDRRWLVDNYYYRIRGGVAFLINDANLSSKDIKIDELGLKDATEKAAFFLSMMEALAGGRFMVLWGNSKRILDFCDRFPKFNGKAYYFYKDFDYPDFDWIGYEDVESYNRRHLDRFYVTLLAHYEAELARDKKAADDIYRNSILSKPEYFKFSGMQRQLENLYNSRNQFPS